MSDQEKSIFDWAKEYWQYGLNPLPIEPGEKRPAVPWKPYTQRRVTEDELSLWWPEGSARGIGTVMGAISGITGADCDRRDNAVWWWQNKTRTELMSKTGGGGVHYLYSYVPGGNKAHVLGRKIDVRNDGGFLVLPPTVHESGNRYQWVKWPVSRDKLPVFDYAWVGRSPSKVGFVQDWVRDPIRVIMSISAIREKPGEYTTNAYKVACILSEHMSFGEAMAVYRAWNIARAKPQFPESELVRKLTEAFDRECVKNMREVKA